MKVTIETFQGNAAYFIKKATEMDETISITKDGSVIASVIPEKEKK